MSKPFTRPAGSTAKPKPRAVEKYAATYTLPQLRQRLLRAERQTHPAPTLRQREAGNYPKGIFRLKGLEISIENPKGSIRSGTNKGGKAWSVVLPYAYGYIKGTVGRDKDHLDIFVGPFPDSDLVCVVDQVDPKTGSFDEHKIMAGFRSKDAAKQAYMDSYTPGWQGFLQITAMTMEQFKRWLENGETTKRIGPQVTEHYARVKPAAGQQSMWNEEDHPRGQPDNAGRFTKSHANRVKRLEGHVANAEAEYKRTTAHYPGRTARDKAERAGSEQHLTKTREWLNKNRTGMSIDGGTPDQQAMVKSAFEIAAQRYPKITETLDGLTVDETLGWNAGQFHQDGNHRWIAINPRFASSLDKAIQVLLHEMTHAAANSQRAKGKTTAKREDEEGRATRRGNDMTLVNKLTKQMGAKLTGAKQTTKTHPTETPAFKAWFADSKIVDDEGKPLVVYHGTADNFEAFDLNHPNRKDTGWLGTGVYLTSDPDTAGSYANLKGGAAPHIKPLYARVQNPYRATIQEKRRLQSISHNEGPEAGRAAADKWTEELKARGYDGVILQYAAKDVGEKLGGMLEIVAFDPTSVKSATGNAGTFDPANTDIRYARDRAVERYAAPHDVSGEPRDEEGKWVAGAGKSIGPAHKASQAEFEAAAIPADIAQQIMQHIRAGQAMSKNKGDETIELPTGPLVHTDIPISLFDKDYLEYIDESTTKARVNEYAKQPIDTPIHAHPPNAWSRKRGTTSWALTDGGHRLMAAIARGDTTIPALVPVTAHAELIEHAKRQPPRERYAMAPQWQESKHKRGQPENAGQFGPGGGGNSSAGQNEGQKKGQPAPAPKPTGAVHIGGHPFEILRRAAGWFFRINAKAPWSKATPAAAKAIESRQADADAYRKAHAEHQQAVWGDVPEADRLHKRATGRVKSLVAQILASMTARGDRNDPNIEAKEAAWRDKLNHKWFPMAEQTGRHYREAVGRRDRAAKMKRQIGEKIGRTPKSQQETTDPDTGEILTVGQLEAQQKAARKTAREANREQSKAWKTDRHNRFLQRLADAQAKRDHADADKAAKAAQKDADAKDKASAPKTNAAGAKIFAQMVAIGKFSESQLPTTHTKAETPEEKTQREAAEKAQKKRATAERRKSTIDAKKAAIKEKEDRLPELAAEHDVDPEHLKAAAEELAGQHFSQEDEDYNDAVRHAMAAVGMTAERAEKLENEDSAEDEHHGVEREDTSKKGQAAAKIDSRIARELAASYPNLGIKPPTEGADTEDYPEAILDVIKRGLRPKAQWYDHLDEAAELVKASQQGYRDEDGAGDEGNELVGAGVGDGGEESDWRAKGWASEEFSRKKPVEKYQRLRRYYARLIAR